MTANVFSFYGDARLLHENNGLLILFSCVFTCLSAQLIKVVLYLLTDRKLDMKILFSTGGMPSSHSALVSSLSTMIGLTEGINSVSFAVATVFALIVTHDAMSVRRSVGIQARSINDLNMLFAEIMGEMSELFSTKENIELVRIKELLGHTPLEVCIGVIYGVLSAMGLYWVLLCP